MSQRKVINTYYTKMSTETQWKLQLKGRLQRQRANCQYKIPEQRGACHKASAEVRQKENRQCGVSEQEKLWIQMHRESQGMLVFYA